MVRVTATESGVALDWSSPGPWLLTGLAVGRLRGALAAAAVRSALASRTPDSATPSTPIAHLTSPGEPLWKAS